MKQSLITLSLYLADLFCFINLIIWPVNKYEWMKQDSLETTLPIDSNQYFYLLIAVLPIVVLIVLTFSISCKRAKKLHLMILLLLVLGAMYKFHSLIF